MIRIACVLVPVALFASLAAAAEGRLSLERGDEEIVVKVDGELFTRYLTKSGAKPILWPVIGPNGKEMTRGYPMRDPQGKEKKDHIHHRSFWFTHGDVNGVSFWDEQGNHGNTVHREFLRAEIVDGKAIIATKNDWLGHDGKKHAEDERTLTFAVTSEQRLIDFDIVLRATEGELKFGDTKEGTFGVRVAGSMDADSPEGGHIQNSEGLKDGATWGKRAAWVDYFGPVDGEVAGLAILNHPSSFRFPTYWHVRTYGLFAANPFGWHDFLADKNADGSVTLAKGEELRLRYRVVLHRGDAEQGRIAEAFAAYAEEAKD